jgi:hypothetical protein
MKICVELDKEMEERWEYAKEALEKAFVDHHSISVSLTDSEILAGLLLGWDFAETARTPFFYTASFGDDDVQALANRKQKNST